MENHRTAEQLADMEQLEARGLCLFCPDGLAQHGRQRVLQKGNSAVVCESTGSLQMGHFSFTGDSQVR